MRPFISLLSDFGPDNYLVGAMKSVIKKINPEADIIDLCHDISPFSIVQAAFVLASAVPYSPTPTIFVAVVDPGVGSERRPLLAVGENHYYILPDNGILTEVLSIDSISLVIELDQEHYMLPRHAETFHGRDVFAPTAAWFSKTHDVSMFGEPIENYTVLEIPKPRPIQENTLSGVVLFSDHFGNLVTNIPREQLDAMSENHAGKTPLIRIGAHEIPGIKQFYLQASKRGEPIALVGSLGYLEIAVRESNARAALGSKPGDEIQLTWPSGA